MPPARRCPGPVSGMHQTRAGARPKALAGYGPATTPSLRLRLAAPPGTVPPVSAQPPGILHLASTRSASGLRADGLGWVICRGSGGEHVRSGVTVSSIPGLLMGSRGPSLLPAAGPRSGYRTPVIRTVKASCPCRILHPWLLTSWGGSVTPPAMITGHVSAVRLPAGYAAGRVVVAVPARGIVEERGDPAAAPPARGPAAAAQGAAEAFLGGPGADRGAARCDPARPPGLWGSRTRPWS
jgi:hypothetical protein